MKLAPVLIEAGAYTVGYLLCRPWLRHPRYCAFAELRAVLNVPARQHATHGLRSRSSKCAQEAESRGAPAVSYRAQHELVADLVGKGIAPAVVDAAPPRFAASTNAV